MIWSYNRHYVTLFRECRYFITMTIHMVQPGEQVKHLVHTTMS